LAILLGAAANSVIAGPPYVTDDPDPVEYRHWEIYLASQWSSANREVSGTVPTLEANYGLLPEVQISAMAQLSDNATADGRRDYHPGDLEVGIKYRFIRETAGMPQVSIYPSVEVPATDSSGEPGAQGVQFFVPLWLQKSFGPWTTFGGGGYQADMARPSENFWLLGWEGQRDLWGAVTAGAELFTVSHQAGFTGAELGFNLGVTVNASRHHHILASLGRDIAGINQFAAYFGYLLTI
jgi:hypothetical protein